MKLKCPVCGQYEFQEDDDCDVCNKCGWENDSLQLNDPDFWGGANDISLNQAREIWEQTHDIKAIKIANNRACDKLPIFDEEGKVILTDA